MIPGFNLDIKHKGKTFHIQTEDSGSANPVIMTHLFIFGTILGSRRLEYGDATGRPDLAEHVRELMRAELKAMHRSLLAGEFDELARRPQKKGASEIQPARKTGNQAPVGTPATKESDPLAILNGDELLEDLDLMESLDEAPQGVVDPSADQAVSVLESVERVTVIEEPMPARASTAPMERTTTPSVSPRGATPIRAPRAGLEFPTELVAETRFDDVILAWLLEDVDEP